MIRLQYSNFCENLSLLILDLTKSMKKNILYFMFVVSLCVFGVYTSIRTHVLYVYRFWLIIIEGVVLSSTFCSRYNNWFKKQKKWKLYLTRKNGIYPWYKFYQAWDYISTYTTFENLKWNKLQIGKANIR